jgi:hypothetical protein
MLVVRLAEAHDPGLPIGEIATYEDGNEHVSFDPNYKGEHQGEFPPVPLWLKIANVIAMPVVYILPEDGFKGLSDQANVHAFLLAMLGNSVAWGLVIVFIFRHVPVPFCLKQMMRGLLSCLAGKDGK